MGRYGKNDGVEIGVAIVGGFSLVLFAWWIILRQSQRIKRLEYRVRVAKAREDGVRSRLSDQAADHAREIANIARDYAAREQDIKKTTADQITNAQSVTQSFAKQLVELANKPPVVIREDISGLADALSKILSPGANTISTDNNDQTRQTNMDTLGLSNNADVQPQQWFPDVEFDEFMEGQEKWPTTGGWVTGTPSTPGAEQSPVHRIVNGQLMRQDGQPMFQTGTGAPPPVGGVE